MGALVFENENRRTFSALNLITFTGSRTRARPQPLVAVGNGRFCYDSTNVEDLEFRVL